MHFQSCEELRRYRPSLDQLGSFSTAPVITMAHVPQRLYLAGMSSQLMCNTIGLDVKYDYVAVNLLPPISSKP